MKSAALLLAFAAGALLPRAAEAGCVGDTKVERYEVALSPDLDCLGVDVTGSECVPGLEITLKNDCAEALTLNREFELVEVFPGESRTFDYEDHESGQESTVEFAFDLGGDDHTLTLTYLAKDDMNAYDTCSAGGIGRAPMGAAHALLLLGLGVLGWRRRRA